MDKKEIRVPLDITREKVRSTKWLPLSLEDLAPGCQIDLVVLLDQLQELRKESTGQMPVLMDENIWLRIMKFMYSKSYMDLNIRDGLKDLAFIYGVWHPYKFACLHIYRKFYPIFMYLEKGVVKSGTNVPSHPKLAWVEKMIAGVWVCGHSLISRIDHEISRLETYWHGIQTRNHIYATRRINDERDSQKTAREAVHEIYASRRINLKMVPSRIDNLKQIRLLITDFCPAIFGVGCMVRSCNWDGRTYGSAVHARTALQWALCILLRLSPDEVHKIKYIKTICLALLMWTPWYSATPGCMHSEEGCEALLSKVTQNLRKHPTRSDHSHYFDVFILTKQSRNELLSLKGGLPDTVVEALRTRIEAFLDSNQLLPNIQWTSDKVCTVGDGFTHKMESGEVPFTEVLQKELLRQELKRSLKSLTSGSAVSSQLKDHLQAAYDKCNESNRREYLQALQNLQGTRAPPRPPVVEPRKRRRIAGMHESWFIYTFLSSGNCHTHK